jgi:hypothetical protein
LSEDGSRLKNLSTQMGCGKYWLLRFSKVLRNGVTGDVDSAQIQMSGYAAYRELVCARKFGGWEQLEIIEAEEKQVQESPARANGEKQ